MADRRQSEASILTAAEALDELAAKANREHGLVQAALLDGLEHAVGAGEALRIAKDRVGYGAYGAWLAANFTGTEQVARHYVRFAEYREELGAAHVTTIKAATLYLRGLGTQSDLRRVATPEAVAEAKRLHKAGAPAKEIAGLLSVSQGTVTAWVDPQFRRSWNARQKKRAQARRSATVALRREQTQNAARALGGPIEESYSLIRRALQLADRAFEVSSGREEREALRRTITALHRAEDEIGAAIRKRDPAEVAA